MSSEFNNLRVEQIQSAVNAYGILLTKRLPSRGWLKEIREALGRTERQQAGRLGISGSTLHKSEQSEAQERISLDLDEQDGQTPLDPDEKAGLIPRHIDTKGALNDCSR